MAKYIIRRVLSSGILLILAATLTFFIVHATPGNPYARMINEMLELNPKLHISFNFIAEITYPLIDPRIQYSG